MFVGGFIRKMCPFICVVTLRACCAVVTVTVDMLSVASFIKAIRLFSSNFDIFQIPIKPAILPRYDFGPSSRECPCCYGQNFNHIEALL